MIAVVVPTVRPEQLKLFLEAWQQIHFHTQSKIIHGITLLQKYYPLSV